MASFCPIANVSELPFRKIAFANTHAIKFMHSAPPRFGYRSDLNVLIEQEGDADDANDYIKGLLASSVAMFLFFFIWFAILLVLKCCCGPKRVGFWSGSGTPLPPSILLLKAPKLEPIDTTNMITKNGEIRRIPPNDV
jgi:hypothetical protein